MEPEQLEYTLEIDGTSIDYIKFGQGRKDMLLIPGLSINTIKGLGKVISSQYRMFCSEFTVYVVDRKNSIPEHYTIEDLADDCFRAMEILGVKKASIFGVSQGGMIAQYLAIKYPEFVERMVLGETLSRPNATSRSVLGHWADLASERRFRELNEDIFTKLFSDGFVARYKDTYMAMNGAVEPADPQRFIRLADACHTCCTYDRLDAIKCPVLVIGSKNDKVLTGEAAVELAQALGCGLYMYEVQGHAAYDEAPDYKQKVFDFLIG